MKKIFAIIFSLLVVSTFAAELNGIKFDDKVKVSNVELTLNGIGIRKATIFKVKVYYGGLYLEQKTNDASKFLNTTSPKQIVMNFVHDVDAEKLRKGFNEGLEKANKNFNSLKSSMEKFDACLVDVVKNDKIVINFLSDGVQVNVKGHDCEKISSAEFSKGLLSIWFINPADEGLTNGLLSK